jgi:hypothetical protein
MNPSPGAERSTTPRSAVDRVRDLGRQGLLSATYAAAPATERACLTGGGYEIAWRVVYERLTRRFEYKRGHRRCAVGIDHLEPACLDNFHTAVEAVLADLFRYARVPIHNLEGWITRRLVAATVNDHRRMRGERGALQRPRLPRWLVKELPDSPWFRVLAVEVLVWVGVPNSAGTGVWPLDAWTERRAAITGDPRSSEADTVRDLHTVLAVMRHKRDWYDQYVERPLSHKEPSTVPLEVGDRPYEVAAERSDDGEARLLDLAALALEAIQARLAAGDDPASAVETVLRTAFGTGTDVTDLDHAPGAGPSEDERLRALLADKASLDDLVRRVLAIVSEEVEGR